MNIEVRSDSVLITGYVNAVERLSKPIRESLGGTIRTFLERIKSGVFNSALKRNKDVLVLLNHNPERILARTSDGSARLEEDNIGLRAEITITDKEVVEKANQGKLSGWSFGFIANADNLDDKDNQSGLPIRTLEDLDLKEVSILDDTKEPAYYGTSIEARGGSGMKFEIRANAFEQEELVEETTEETQESPAEKPEEETKAEETINVEELANTIADIIIAKLKAEDKKEDMIEDKVEEQVKKEIEQKADDEEEGECRSVDYSSFEKRLAELG